MRRPDKAITAPVHSVQFATIANTAAITGVSESRIERLLKAGTLRAKKLEGRTLMDVPFMLAWMNELPDWQSRTAA